MILNLMTFLPRRFRHISRILNNVHYEFCHFPNSHLKVVSCQEAVLARNINLNEELKSIIVNIKGEFFVIHLRGSQRIDSKKILKIFNIPFKKKKSFRFATLNELKYGFNVEPGLICPFTRKIWNCKHIISNELIKKNDFVYTNNGTFFGYVKFKPTILLKTKNNKCLDITENTPYNNV